MRKILLTGGAGFIGGSLAEKLVRDERNEVVIIDNLLTGKKEFLPSRVYPNWKFIKCDVNDYNDIASVMMSHRFDYVFHYAAVVGVQRTLQNPTMVLNDINGIKNILDLSKNTGVKRFYYSSSSEVYGESVSYPQDEISTPLNSRLPYAVVKNVGEAFCTSYKREYDLDYTIFRFFNTYGPRQSTDFVVSKFLEKALNGTDISIYGDGLQSRTFCYIDDNVDACLKVFNEGHYNNKVMNVGNDVETPIIELAQNIIDICGSPSKIVYKPPLKEGDMRRRCPNLKRMRKIMNRDLIPLRTGIIKLLESGVFNRKMAGQQQ